MDNVSKYTQPQTGLFHVKLASTRMVANEHWGTPNSKAPWSLWRMNTLLGRKAVSVGWKTKKLTQFRPAHELILTLTLPANIIDAFHVCCPARSLEAWLKNLSTFSDLRMVANQVRDRLCSGQRVESLRSLPDDERDMTLENIILFNRDALILREFYSAIKRGDIGSVVNVLYYWVHQFRGTGMMPKYSDTIFELLMELKDMPSALKHGFEMNWLVNLTGEENRFKEVDLMQEHQNFWQKVSLFLLLVQLFMCRGYLGYLLASRLEPQLVMADHDFSINLHPARRDTTGAIKLQDAVQWKVTYEPKYSCRD